MFTCSLRGRWLSSIDYSLLEIGQVGSDPNGGLGKGCLVRRLR